MKLEYEKNKLINRKNALSVILVIFLLIGILITTWYVWLYVSLKIDFVMVFVVFLGCLMPILFIVLAKQHKNDAELKTIGERVSAYIVDTGLIKGRGRMKEDVYYLTLIYNGKQTGIYQIKNNKAYRMLTLLLNPYPVKKVVKIPIDVYVYKNKIYADLESVDFTKIEGYDEVIKIIEEI